MTRTQQDQAGDPSPAAEMLLRAQDLVGFLRTTEITKYTPVLLTQLERTEETSN